jgi:hypothetical protein
VGGKDFPSRGGLKTEVPPRLAVLGTIYPTYNEKSLTFTKKALGGRHSKDVGSDFERKVVHTLSQWWGAEFRRTPSSGGWDKLSSDGQVQAAGDIWSPPEANFPFCVECKRRKEPLDFFAPYSETSDIIVDWWEQCIDDALRAKKRPLLIMRCGNREYAAYIFASIELLDSTEKTPPEDFREVTLSCKSGVFNVMRLEDFVSSYKKRV